MMSQNGKAHPHMEPQELLQQKLAQLELGFSLDELLEGVGVEEARLLQLAAALQATPFPAPDDAAVAAHRASFLQAAGELTMNPNPTPSPQETTPTTTSGFLAWVQSLLDGLLQRREFAYGLAAVLAVAILAVGVGLFQGGGEEPLVEPEAPALVETESEAETAESANPPAASEHEQVEQTAESAVVEAVPTPSGFQAFLPMASSPPLVLTAETAALEIVHGHVELQAADGSWAAVAQVSTLTAGQRVRTGALSSAKLTFYDGSQATLSADSELSIDQLTALRPEQGFRTVVLTQHVGESEHSVEFRNDGGSRYEVNTPAGSGLARGTKFRVIVTPALLAEFAVLEGRVDVTSLNQTVQVVAGQATAVLAGSRPETPTFRIYGEGEVNQMGAVWLIAGQAFTTHNHTVIIGNPQMGDLVWVDGRLRDDGSRTADRIVLIRRAVANQFALTGEATAIAATVWTVAGQTILVGENTRIDDDIALGDTVRVQGVIVAGGTLRAERIERLDEQVGMPFRFTGLVESTSTDSWVISGVTIAISTTTRIEEGIVVGDVVEASGRVQANGTWLARNISLVQDDDLPEFSFTGRVQSMEPWQVAGISFETREWTAVDPNVSVGKRVRVRGVILADGTWVASSIDRLSNNDNDDDGDDDESNTIVIVGVVSSTNPWVVNGLQLFITADSRINGNIIVGDVVRVRIRLTANGLWEVVSIRPLTPRFGLGCFAINTTVLGIGPNQLTLQHWPALNLDDDGFALVGSVERNSIVTFTLCFAINGRVIIISPVIIIYQPIIIIIPSAPAPPRGNGNRNDND